MNIKPIARNFTIHAAPMKEWSKTQCYYWNPVESTAQTCYTETYPGDQPPDWDTAAYTPYFNGRDVIYGPGAVQWDR